MAISVNFVSKNLKRLSHDPQTNDMDRVCGISLCVLGACCVGIGVSLQALRDAKELRKQGERLRRQGLAERVFTLVDEFNKNRSYKNAIVLAGRLKAIAQACKFDSYWDEKCCAGFEHEKYDLESVTPLGTVEGKEESWWIK